MKKRTLMALLLAALLAAGCGSGGGDGSPLSKTPDSSGNGGDPGTDPGTDPGGNTPPAPPGELGALLDLGDLFAPQGDNWYFTEAAAMNDHGEIVGQSNAGSPVKGAYLWSPGTETMNFLGIHFGAYDDYYNLKPTPSDNVFRYSEAVGINNNGIAICNSTTGANWPDEEEKRAFLYNPSYITSGSNPQNADDPNSPYIDLLPPPFYDDQGKLVIHSFSETVAINNHGHVILTADDKEGQHAYFWDGVSTTPYIDLQRDDGAPWALENDGITPKALYVPDYVLLGRIIGEDGEAVALNNNNQTVINSGDTAIFHDLGDDVNDPNDDIIEALNHLPGASSTTAVDINDVPPSLSGSAGARGHIIGNSGSEGFFWDGGAMYPLGSLGGGSSEVTDLNNTDVVVGSSTTSDGTTHAFRWSLVNGKGVMEDLGTLGGANSFAVAVNDAGQIVGYSETGETYQEGGVTVQIEHAFLWDRGTMYDLGTHNDFYNDPDFYPFVPSFPFSRAVSINEVGQVAGNSESINAHPRGFLLTPTFP